MRRAISKYSHILFRSNILRLKQNERIQSQSLICNVRLLSTKPDDTESFRDTLKRMQEKKHNDGDIKDKQCDSDTENSTDENKNTTPNKQSFSWSYATTTTFTNIQGGVKFVIDNIKQGYSELVNDKEGILEKKVHQAETYRKPKSQIDEVIEDEYLGPSAIVLVKEPTSAWDQMKNRLNNSPFIREMLKRTRHITDTVSETDVGKVAQKIGQNVKEKIEDAREFWATSQNPLVYSVSGMIDSITGETEEGMAINEIRKLDPGFITEEWTEAVSKTLAPKILSAHLRGDTAALRPWLGEAVYNKLAADIRLRKSDGTIFDPNILDIEEKNVIIRLLEGTGPIILVVYMVQQINCIRNKKGEVIEGGESDVRAKFYSMAFQQQYVEETGVVRWKVVDYEFAGDIPYF